MNLKYGLNPSPEPPALKFGTYLVPNLLPTIPQTFGRANLFPKDGWGTLKNAGIGAIGDCTVAGSMHAAMLWRKLAGVDVDFTDHDAQDDYSAITGYVPGDDSTDTGADMVAVAKYWQRTGFRDAVDQRHYIAAYLGGRDPPNWEHVYAGCYLFAVVGLSVRIPTSAPKQFEAGEPWHVVRGDSIEGYHFLPLFDRTAAGNGLVVTWGAQQEVTQQWLETYTFEVVYYISAEEMVNGETSEGFDMAALEGDLAIIGG